MTAEERLADLERYLFDEYQTAFEMWTTLKTARGDRIVAVRCEIFAKLQTLFVVARQLITGGDPLQANVFNERLIIFTQHHREL